MPVTYLSDLAALLIVVLAVYGITCTDNRLRWSIATVVFLPLVGPGLAVYGLGWLVRWRKVDPQYRHGFPTRQHIVNQTAKSEALWYLRGARALNLYGSPIGPYRTSRAKMSRIRQAERARKSRERKDRRLERDERRLIGRNDEADAVEISGFNDLLVQYKAANAAGSEPKPPQNPGQRRQRPDFWELTQGRRAQAPHDKTGSPEAASTPSIEQQAAPAPLINETIFTEVSINESVENQPEWDRSKPVLVVEARSENPQDDKPLYVLLSGEEEAEYDPSALPQRYWDANLEDRLVFQVLPGSPVRFRLAERPKSLALERTELSVTLLSGDQDRYGCFRTR